jgi:SAM-dependent methyltransferase
MKNWNFVEIALRTYHLVIPPKMDREIGRAFSTPQQEFPKSVNLPRHYGEKMTERVVEILIARLTYRFGRRVLDVGHANAMNVHLRMLKSLPGPVDVTGIDITAANNTVRSIYTHSVVENITKTSFPEKSFDLIWCISALEHFGMDNSIYTDQFTLDKQMDLKALEEMLRILREGGTIYISVPYGKFEDHGWLKNYDRNRWQKLLDGARATTHIDELYFRYSDQQGWSVASPDELSDTGYSDGQNNGASGLAVALIHKLRK